MEANELMIGDWVLHDGEPYQIRQLGIYGVDRDGEDYPAVCVGKPKGVGLIVERNEISPIPLTQDILEKNEIYTVFKTRYKGFYLEYHAEAGMIMLYVYNNGSFHPTGIGFKYVHELQHAMRLCGIEKEIVI